MVATCLEATCAHFYFSQTAEKHSTGSQQCGENDVITKKYILEQIYVMFAGVCVSVSTSLWAKKVQRKRSKAPRDIINEGSATSGGSSQNNNCRQFGGPRNCLFVKHFSLFDMSTSSSDRGTRRTELKDHRNTRQIFLFLVSSLSLSFLVSRFLGTSQNGQPTETVWDF